MNSSTAPPGIVALLLFTLLTGVFYPLVVTGIAQLFFPRQANGSLITQAGQTVGSELIGQKFAGPKYFWGRPSATAGHPYNAFDAVRIDRFFRLQPWTALPGPCGNGPTACGRSACGRPG